MFNPHDVSISSEKLSNPILIVTQSKDAGRRGRWARGRQSPTMRAMQPQTWVG